VLELAMEQAKGLRHEYVGTEHLLLGLLAEERGIAAQVLHTAGVKLATARTEILKILGTEMPPQVAVPGVSHQAPVERPPSGTVERAELVLHYDDGRRYQASFASAQDAQGFLARSGIGRRE
jgi:ATP-dependent Clp protease ATP-binding subunit ClpC